MFAKDPPKSASFFDLLEKLLDYSPSRRLTAAQALDHKFFDELKDTGKRLRINGVLVVKLF